MTFQWTKTSIKFVKKCEIDCEYLFKKDWKVVELGIN